jgi:MFS family permease
MGLLGTAAGRVARRYGSKSALIVGSVVSAVAFGFFALAHSHPYQMLITTTLLGIGIGLAFAALGNLIVQAVPSTQTGVASGMNTVMRTLGGALGGQLSATFIVAHSHHGLPAVTGFTESYVLATVFLIICAGAGLLVPALPGARVIPTQEPGLVGVSESG